MYINKEIEFKTFISKDQYDSLLNEFGLDNNVFAQTNYYFDTDDTKLIQEQTVLRIRQKGNNYKITKKTRAEVGADETHILISKDVLFHDVLKHTQQYKNRRLSDHYPVSAIIDL